MRAFYHTSDRYLPPGTKIRPQKGGHAKQWLETIFEKVRQENFPDRPPRVGSVFVCPDLKGFCSGRFRPYVYQVKIQGAKNVFWANAEMWTEAVYNPDRAASYADSYWRIPVSANSWHFFKEVLVFGGSVTVLHEVTEKENAQKVIQAFYQKQPYL